MGSRAEMVASTPPTSLYDAVWVANGCHGNPPPDTSKDITEATYTTYYVVAALSLISFLAVLTHAFQCVSEEGKQSRFAMSLHFLFFGLGCLIAGMEHEVALRTSETNLTMNLGYSLI